MRPLVLLLSVWVLLLSGWSAAAQPSSDQGKWSGRASLTAGYGWSMPDEELALTDTLSRFRQTAEVVLRYERKKFFVVCNNFYIWKNAVLLHCSAHLSVRGAT